MKILSRYIFTFFFLVSLQLSFAENKTAKPTLILANVYHPNINIKNYWVSEKYDGVRALWTGEKLISRQGTIFNAPDWFIVDFPNTKLDGELWLGRQSFAKLSGIVRTLEPDGQDWKLVKYMVFDLPDHQGNFNQRLDVLKQLIEELNIPWLQSVPQWKVNDHDELIHQLQNLTAKGAEGLMLHRVNSYYHAKRSNDLLKLKLHQDAEAKVIKYLRGKGLFEGMMGSMLVEMADGRRFKIGTGFTHEQRANPPPIGSIITFQYDGLTTNGLPRFARFLRVREKIP